MVWELLNTLKTAIIFEREGLETYLKCAMQTDSVQGKDMYVNLAQDEHSHVQKLHERLNELLVELLNRGDLAPGDFENIFSVESQVEGEARRPPEIPEQETAILEMAIENEIGAQEFYNQQAEKGGEPLMQTLYRTLAKQESSHEKLLRAELDSVKGLGHWFDFREFTLEAPG